jgi:pyruvate dehydrogenase E2 component (dihydrolipoamide acetyltransferase)
VALVAQDIPKIGLVMDAVKVVRWLKNVGDIVKLGEPLVEVETEKSIVEIEARASGRLAQILVQVDQEATVGDRIAWIESDQAQSGVAAATPATQMTTPTISETEVRATPIAPPGDRVRSSPVARKLAAERGLDLGAVAGSGPGGRIQLEDVRRALDSAPDTSPPPIALPGLQPLSPMRRAVARAMTRSNADIPQFIVERSVDMSLLQLTFQLRAWIPLAPLRLPPGNPTD